MTDTGNFKEEAWNEVEKEFNDKFKVSYPDQSFRTEYSNAKAKYQIFQSLMNLSGQPFSYNADTFMVEGDDNQWDSVIDAAPKSKQPVYKQLRKKPYPLVPLMEELLEGEMATGEGASTLEFVARKRLKVATLSDEETSDVEVLGTPKPVPKANSRESTPSSVKSISKKNGAVVLGDSIKEMGMMLSGAIESKRNTKLTAAINLLNATGPHGAKLPTYINLLKLDSNAEVFVALGDSKEEDGELSRMLWIKSLIQ